MMLLWILLGAASAFVMMAASRTALRHAVAVSRRLRVPPFVIGFTLVAIGTDLPELINSVVSSFLGHGDINLGDSVGSAFTQGTLVLGLFPFFARSLRFARRDVVLIPALTIVALAVGVWVSRDGMVSRPDAAFLIVTWLAATLIVWRARPEDPPPPAPASDHSTLVHVVLALAALGVVGVAAAGLVHAVTQLATTLGVPEYLVAFFGASLGTSMPELAVEITALRANESQIALGDILGSCLVDGSLSMGLGPLVFPTAVTAGLAHDGAALAMVAMALIALLLGIRGAHDRRQGVAMIVLYVLAYLFLFARG